MKGKNIERLAHLELWVAALARRLDHLETPHPQPMGGSPDKPAAPKRQAVPSDARAMADELGDGRWMDWDRERGREAAAMIDWLILRLEAKLILANVTHGSPWPGDWISVKDRWPPLDEEKLVLDKHRDIHQASREHVAGFGSPWLSYDSDGEPTEIQCVTHWMDLPSLPPVAGETES